MQVEVERKRCSNLFVLTLIISSVKIKALQLKTGQQVYLDLHNVEFDNTINN